MRLVKAAEASPHAKFYSLSTGYRAVMTHGRSPCSSIQKREIKQKN